MSSARPWALVACLLLVPATVLASTPSKIAVLDFELSDLTLTPNSTQELARTASLRGLLEQALSERSEARLVRVSSADQQAADQGFGYLFDHPEAAASLAAQSEADYVVVGRLHKPSDLFAYLRVHLVQVGSGRVVGDYVVEVKGAVPALTQRGVSTLAKNIDGTLRVAATQ